ncbi:MAG: GNAT family N-acetyltransferase [Anaerolineales bacterium]|nr:GNAT family N-acetyltransferase [Anaerolineales bacterium]
MPPFLRSTGQRLTVSPTTPADRQDLERLLDAARWRHLHLDWFDPVLLIEEAPFLKLANSRSVLACLGCPPEFPHRTWIRVFAAAGAVGLQEAWDHLWPATLQAAQAIGLRTFEALVTAAWMAPLLSAAGFVTSDEVVFLERDGARPLRRAPSLGEIRSVSAQDLPALVELDAQAFPESWRISWRSLQAAWSSAAHASLVDFGGEILGYQITSLSPTSAHLSRLAVAPDRARQGLGAALTLDSMDVLSQMGASRWTVNTQASNLPALGLYQRLGFRENGLRYPVYTARL